MSNVARSIMASPVARVLVGAVAGALAALAIGLIGVRLMSGDGFGDLAAAALTLVLGLPTGAILGGFLGYWLWRDRGKTV